MDGRYAAARPPRFAEGAQVARRPRSRLVRHVALALTTLALATLALTARADAFVYWTWNITPPTTQASGIGRANLDGTGVNQSFIAGVAPVVYTTGLAVDGAHVYWASGFGPGPVGSGIGRANLDGTGANPRFITGIPIPAKLAVDADHIYWTSGAGIGRANLDGTGVDESFIDPSATRGGRISGVAVSADHIYWASNTAQYPPPPGGENAIGCANLDGTGVNHGFISATADDVEVDGAHIYWTNVNGIGRANVDGTGVKEGFITATPAYPVAASVAVDGAHVYWGNLVANSSNDTIGRANLDGTGVDQRFIAAGGDPLGVAVDRAVPPSSGPSSCPPRPNDFSFGKLKRNLKKGTAKLSVRVPGPGELVLAKTKRLRADSKQATAAGKISLRMRAYKKAATKLARRGKLKLNARVTFTPPDGAPNTKSKKVKLKRR